MHICSSRDENSIECALNKGNIYPGNAISNEGALVSNLVRLYLQAMRRQSSLSSHAFFHERGLCVIAWKGLR